MISLLVMAFFLSGLFGLYTVSCCLLWLECNTVPCICQAVFFGGWVFPLRGKFFSAAPAALLFPCGCAMLYPWTDGGELAARAGLLSVGGCRGGLAPGALLVHQVTEPLAELLDGLALVSEYQEPEPFGLLGLLYKQFACVRRGHVHLPFLVAVVGGSLGGGRWAVRLPRMIAAIFCAVNRPKSLPTAPL
jgi:hypothetical protein